MKKRAGSGKPGDLLRATRLAGYPWLVHAFTTRRSGNLSDGVGDRARSVERNRARLLPRVASGRSFRLVTLRQVHSDIIRVVGPALRGAREPDGAAKLTGDALITNQPGLLLAVQVADCLPILVVDPVRHVVANVHAGWRGTLARIAEKTVGQMRLRFGSQPRRLLAVIGPGIHACCYQVGPEVFDRYQAQFGRVEALFGRVEPSPSQSHWHPKVTGRPLKPSARPRLADEREGTRYFLDLVEANRQQLRAAGLEARNIQVLPYCTACRTDRFFSHRAEAGRTGRQMGLVGMTPGGR